MAQVERKQELKKDVQRGFRQQTRETADWLNADAELLRNVVAAVAYTGGAIRFGYTSDGGAYSIGLYGDGQPYTVYVRPSEDINQALRELGAYWSNVAKAERDNRGTTKRA